MKNLNQYLDHTLLKPQATETDIQKLCQEAREYEFYAVCVNTSYVPFAVGLLKGTDVKVAAVVGFPLGACTTETKAFEAEQACKAGASEIDMVIHVGAVKEKRWDYVRQDIRMVAESAANHGGIVKVILETCLLTDEEIATACTVAEEAGALFVKTSTGFSGDGATPEQVELMRRSCSERVSVKASGGIRTYSDVLRMIEAGADRIGASASVAIMKEAGR